jgi:hypothetical protein
MEDKYVVPSELADEGEAMLQLLQEAAKAQGKEADLYLLSAKSSVGFEPVTMSAAVLLIGSTSATWLTKKWVDTYLWPFVQSRIDRPSRKFLDWLGSKLPGEVSPPAETK